MTGRANHPGTKHDRPRGISSVSPRGRRDSAKAAGGLVCEDCGVVQNAGRWYWGAPLARMEKSRCPACVRVRERDPAGILRLPAAFLAYRAEVVSSIRNLEDAERAGHPLERVMAIEQVDGDLVVTTTGIHLARAIAHKLEKRFHQKPRFRYGDGEEQLQVDWEERAPLASAAPEVSPS